MSGPTLGITLHFGDDTNARRRNLESRNAGIQQWDRANFLRRAFLWGSEMVSPNEMKFVNAIVAHFGGIGMDDSEPEVWIDRSPSERLQALEFLRQCVYDYAPSIDRMKKVLEVVDASGKVVMSWRGE